MNSLHHTTGSLLRADSSTILPRTPYKAEPVQRRKKLDRENTIDPIVSPSPDKLTEVDLNPNSNQKPTTNNLDKPIFENIGEELSNIKQVISTSDSTPALEQKPYSETVIFPELLKPIDTSEFQQDPNSISQDLPKKKSTDIISIKGLIKSNESIIIKDSQIGINDINKNLDNSTEPSNLKPLKTSEINDNNIIPTLEVSISNNDNLEAENSEHFLATIRKDLESNSSADKPRLHSYEQTDKNINESVEYDSQSLIESVPFDLSEYPYTLKHEIPVIQHPSDEAIGGLKKPKIDITPKLSFNPNIKFPSEPNIEKTSDHSKEVGKTDHLKIVDSNIDKPADNQEKDQNITDQQTIIRSKKKSTKDSKKSGKNIQFENLDKVNSDTVRIPSNSKLDTGNSIKVSQDSVNKGEDTDTELGKSEKPAKSRRSVKFANTVEQVESIPSIQRLSYQSLENNTNLVQIDNELSSEGFIYKEPLLNLKDKKNKSKVTSTSKKRINKFTNKNKSKLTESSDSDKDSSNNKRYKESSDSDKDSDSNKVHNISDIEKDKYSTANTLREIYESDNTSLESLKDPSDILDLRTSLGATKSLKDFSESKDSLDSIGSVSKLFTSRDIYNRDSKSSILSQELFEERSNTFSFSTKDTDISELSESIGTSSIVISIPANNMDSKDDIDQVISKSESRKSSKESNSSEKSLLLDSINVEKDEDDLEKITSIEQTINLNTTINTLESKNDDSNDLQKSSKLESLSYDVDETSTEMREYELTRPEEEFPDPATESFEKKSFTNSGLQEDDLEYLDENTEQDMIRKSL